MDTEQLIARLDAATAPHRLLQHPFYVAWAEGRLTTEDLRFYAAQYWHQVESFPGYLETVAGRLPDATARRIVEDNLADERDDDHPALWLDFAAALGAGSDEVTSSSPEPETRACIDAFRRGMATSPSFALGMLYGYESQTPEVAKTKVEGLRNHYGINGEGTRYFDLHGELDVEHSRDLAQAIATVATDRAAQARAEAGAAAAAAAVWRLLDGVVRARGIN